MQHCMSLSSLWSDTQHIHNALSWFCIHSILIPYQHALFAHRSGSFFGNHVGYIIEPNTDVHFSAGSQYCIAPPCVRHCEALWTCLLLLLLLIQMKQQQLQPHRQQTVGGWSWAEPECWVKSEQRHPRMYPNRLTTFAPLTELRKSICPLPDCHT